MLNFFKTHLVAVLCVRENVHLSAEGKLCITLQNLNQCDLKAAVSQALLFFKSYNDGYLSE